MDTIGSEKYGWLAAWLAVLLKCNVLLTCDNFVRGFDHVDQHVNYLKTDSFKNKYAKSIGGVEKLTKSHKPFGLR